MASAPKTPSAASIAKEVAALRGEVAEVRETVAVLRDLVRQFSARYLTTEQGNPITTEDNRKIRMDTDGN